MQHSLASKLKALRHPRMRAQVLIEYLLDTAADTVVDALTELIDRAVRSGDVDAVLVLAALAIALEDPERVPYARRRTLYTAAKERGRDPVARLFFEANPHRDLPRSEDPLAPERPLTPRGRPLTLGERKALARTHQRELITPMLRDPHPDVVSILVQNPHLTETDVLVLASRRPAMAASLAQIATSERWAPRYRIRLALVKNPYTPVPLAVRLATTLRISDLRQVADDVHLATLLRDQARALSGPREHVHNLAIN